MKAVPSQTSIRGTANATPADAIMHDAGSRQKKQGKSPMSPVTRLSLGIMGGSQVLQARARGCTWPAGAQGGWQHFYPGRAGSTTLASPACAADRTASPYSLQHTVRDDHVQHHALGSLILQLLAPGSSSQLG